MTTRSKQSWRPDSRGYYPRQLGWKLSQSGKLVQHKFLLSADLREAKRVDSKLRELWDHYEKRAKTTGPKRRLGEGFEPCYAEGRLIWPRCLLEVAKCVAKGDSSVVVEPLPQEPQLRYMERIRALQVAFPVLCFLPSDDEGYEVGSQSLQKLEQGLGAAEPFVGSLPIRSGPEVIQAVADAEALLDRVGLGCSSTSPPYLLGGTVDAGQKQTAPEGHLETPSSATTVPSGRSSPSLHRAMRVYQQHLQHEYHRPELNQISAWGKTQIRQVNTLLQHHSDQLLSRLDAQAVDELFRYWRRRPCKIGTQVPMRPKSVGNYIKTLKSFFRWLHKSPDYDWRKPADFEEIDTRVRVLTSDHARKSLDQVDVFTRDELRLLMQYGQPFERMLVLLALNCGFGRAEIASLLVGEVQLRRAHDPRQQEVIDFQTTADDSFIKRVRRKSGVYGEHILFPLTVTGLEWAIQRRQQFPGFSDDAQLLVSEQGSPLDKPTKQGNANQLIPNHFDRLIERLQGDGQNIRKLSFNKLRKTASQLIRNHSDGETMAIFDCHGSPVKSDPLSDVYSNRPFGKVFRAIRKVQDYLTPVFEAAGPTPFVVQPQAYTPRSTLDEILTLHKLGRTGRAIAAAVGVSPATVSRHLQRHREASPNDGPPVDNQATAGA